MESTTIGAVTHELDVRQFASTRARQIAQVDNDGGVGLDVLRADVEIILDHPRMVPVFAFELVEQSLLGVEAALAAIVEKAQPFADGEAGAVENALEAVAEELAARLVQMRAEAQEELSQVAFTVATQGVLA